MCCSDRLSMFGHLTNGLVSGTLTAVCTHPIRTTYVCLMNRQGIPSLCHQYKGFTACMTGIIPNQTISFLVRGVLLKHFDQNTSNATTQILLGVLPAMAYSPSATVSERIMTVAQVHKFNFLKSCRTIYQINGIRSCFKGFVPVLIKEICFITGVFPCSDLLVARYGQGEHVAASSCTRLFVGACMGFSTTPLETIRSRMQQDLTGQYPTIRSTVRQILKEEGSKGLWKGKVPRTIFVSLAIFFLASARQHVPSYLNLS